MSDFFDSREAFVARFGGVFEHSPWIAEAAWDAGLPADARTAQGLHAALVTQFRAAERERRLGVLLAHPDLAGRLAVRGELTADSTAEQASAGLDKCTPEEYARFQELNDAYKARFGFPFILAVRGLTRAEILENFEARVGNDTETEFATATAQVERIALLRLKEMLP
ncbi:MULTISPECIES: 2-oxo-4-hydroxy-4-carboxy-5-ureidoimidazoline decarboxylase [Nitrospirillum]|uniref:2-oxo-4-hydroxy-4-carboxy-5-ureidoimidazoline decarboxylase n=1 Tax=Nitrospirillum amazonense TaxID=28077 RepID=A0A560F056_9PROT|nr:2-oxo-4-hydroxy-4-carboxy-5-ureidoimidazoline decarboxylase [Nitrospirillum amazonense]MEC4593904.1 2-oxo-4-hydroxy-4-carboxy-5-ureidoimidazoline decarboxylase [Nitrospirillum amazonense]TWB15016.1 OHCU decarboxylase [Nitrospirillum amazonense]